MEKRHIIQLQGREFVTYEGLLEEAHRKGLKSIVTTLVQIPSDENGQVAICTAEVQLEADGERRVFTGIGDASPRNVSRNIAPHLIRMSETRAKARALRDAINVGLTAVEELEGAEMPRELGAPITFAAREIPEGPLRAGREQGKIEEVAREMRRVGMSTEEGRNYLLQRFSKASRFDLTEVELDHFLKHLKELPNTAPK